MTGRLIKTAIIVLVLCHFSLFSAGTAEGIDWKTDWENALKTAAAKKQPVLMDFYTDWCPPCKRLAAETFVDKTMIDYFHKENYVLIKVNPEKDRVAESKFKAYSYPTLIIFKPDGTELDRIIGFRSTKDLIKNLDDLKKGIGTLEDLLGKYKKFKKENTSAEKFKLMFGINDKYIAKADYPDALKMIDAVIQLDKNNAQKQAAAAMYQRGYVYYKWKKFKQAAEALTSIHKVFPESEEAQNGFAAAAYYAEKGGETALALKIAKDFLKKYPDSKHAKRMRKKLKKLEEK
ncbi:MAG: thioredoxin fold domain-containing protein [bacterium]|nr:thioredoxin fold domain-containing protein [bacterium]